MKALIAVGGNSLIRAGEKGTAAQQFANARRTAAAIANLLEKGWRCVITHGNGPQVGAQLLRCERAADQVSTQPLDVCGAATQGEIGYVLGRALEDEFAARHLDIPVAAVLTQTVVAADDPAMQHPTKPIGPFYSREEAERRRRELGWDIVEDASRGYRRVVPSPEPIDIVESDTIRSLLDSGVLVIAAGGGGIPVVRVESGLRGVEAVIDKDRASALLALRLGVDLFLISTDTDYVYLDYKLPSQRAIHCVTALDMERHLRDGHFPPGNMGPKVESALRFLRGSARSASGNTRGPSTEREVIITSYDYLCDAVAGRAGTHILGDAAERRMPSASLDDAVEFSHPERQRGIRLRRLQRS